MVVDEALKLNIKQSRFAREYMMDRNATQAAIRAGYSKHTAGKTGHRLLQHPLIRAQINELTKTASEETKITPAEVLSELHKIAMCDITEAFDPETGALKNLQDIPRDVRKVISSIKVKEITNEDGELTGYTREIRFWPKAEALKMLGQHLTLFKEEINVNVIHSVAHDLDMGRRRLAQSRVVEAEVLDSVQSAALPAPDLGSGAFIVQEKDRAMVEAALEVPVVEMVKCDCGYEFDLELLGRYGCPNCHGDAAADADAAEEAANGVPDEPEGQG